MLDSSIQIAFICWTLEVAAAGSLLKRKSRQRDGMGMRCRLLESVVGKHCHTPVQSLGNSVALVNSV